MGFNIKQYLKDNETPNTSSDLGISPEYFKEGTVELETLLKDEGQLNSVHYEVSVERKST